MVTEWLRLCDLCDQWASGGLGVEEKQTESCDLASGLSPQCLALSRLRGARGPRGQAEACLEVKLELNRGNRMLVHALGGPRSQPACLVSAVSSEKKEGWSWESYLEDQKAITAPVSLFQDVSVDVST